VKRFVYASTVYVYSREGGFYRCSKQAAEHYVEEYQRAYGVDYTILRYGSLYGPRSDETNGLFRIVRDALQRGFLSYEGNPDSIREYIHVEDAARASVLALNDEFRNESVVLTGHQSMKVLDLLKMLAEILGMPDEVKFRNEDYAGHYVRTPYAYQPKLGRKYMPPLHVDLGQGLLQLIEEVRKANAKAPDGTR
jgi:UDP-glucose 4-epimerase